VVTNVLPPFYGSQCALSSHSLHHLQTEQIKTVISVVYVLHHVHFIVLVPVYF